MALYTEYLDRKLSFDDLSAERKRVLRTISDLRGGRSVLVYAADLNKGIPQLSIDYSDLLPMRDQIANIQGDEVDLILETPGGSGEVTEDIVKLLRPRFKSVGVIVPGWAKSAGTILTMAADEILMGRGSALGPIDAQIQWQGKVFSADALIEGFEKIKKEVEDTQTLNRAYFPILQGISPGELQNAENALNFAKVLVTRWLADYKFQDWVTHASSGAPVTPEDRKDRAKAIANALCDHRKWLVHGRSITIDDLREMRLKVTNLQDHPSLDEAVQRYYTLLQMTFGTNVYKLVETATSQIYRFLTPVAPARPQLPPVGGDGVAVIDITCTPCGQASKLQANLGKPQPLRAGHLPFPANNVFSCPKCGVKHSMAEARRQLEEQTGQPVVA